MNQAFVALKNILDQSGCDKKQVAAGGYIHYNTGHREFIYATNSCKHEGLCCPRLAMKTGEGYNLCKAKHAEIALVEKFKKLRDEYGDLCWMDTAFIYGHYYACEPCSSALLSIGVSEIRIIEK